MRHFILSLLFIFSLHSIIPVAAQEPGTADGRWDQLMSAAGQAYREGRYADGIPLAKEAYQFALKAFGE